jgi:hypothetical protein
MSEYMLTRTAPGRKPSRPEIKIDVSSLVRPTFDEEEGTPTERCPQFAAGYAAGFAAAREQ